MEMHYWLIHMEEMPSVCSCVKGHNRHIRVQLMLRPTFKNNLVHCKYPTSNF